MRRVAMFGLAASLPLAAPVASATGFTFTAQSRSVSVTMLHSTTDCLIPWLGWCALGPPQWTSTSLSDSESASDYTTFWQAARVASFPQSYATQISSLRRASIAASGTLTGTSDYGVAPPPDRWFSDSSSLSSSFSTSFDVDEATPYRLTGGVTAGGDSDYGATVLGQTTTRVTLKTAGGSVIAEGVVAGAADCPDTIFCNPVDPIPLTSVGILQPGSYVLEAVSTGVAQAFHVADTLILPSTSGSYWVTLEASDLIAVPSLSRGGLACLAAGLILVSLPTLSRLARVRN